MSPRIVIVGASLAGTRTAQALRREGSDARIMLVDAATDVACDRPPLSKAFLTAPDASPDASPKPVLTTAQLGELDVELVLGRRAVSLDATGHAVQLDDGRAVHYDALVVATGSVPRTMPGVAPLPGVHTLRTAEDAAAIRAALAAGARTVVVGGGFIGAEIAWTARSLGCPVTVVEQLPAMLLRGLGPVLAPAFTRRHAAAGVRVLLGAGVTGVAGTGRVEQVLLSDGTAVAADLVVVGVGTAPETAWLRGSGLDVSDGVLCTSRLAVAGADDVYAAGDVARWHHPRYGVPIRVEHWTNAAEHGPVVAANLCGRPTEYDAVPYVWSDQLGARLQIFGRVRPGDEVRYVFGGPDEPRFVAVAGHGDELSAVVGFGALKELMPYRRLLVDGAPWSAAEAVTPSR
ncbi:FAD-dependent oxidoreductase [Dactylosporangium sp. NPDC005572]|uniref:NAD(P)/FAD-dependent oxidoreductase n=1 Tax=Dactylosporangium sp. NPDC005572 TaxID=3156889 RepID=UPI0033B12FAD